MTVCEIRRITLDESLALTAFIAEKDPRQRSRVAARWLLRLLEEHKTVTIKEAALAASALAALGDTLGVTHGCGMQTPIGMKEGPGFAGATLLVT